MKKLIIFDFAGTINCPVEREESLIEVIKQLHLKYYLSIVSSTSSEYIKNYLEDKNILTNFEEILGADPLFDKTERIQKLIKKYSLDPGEVVYVTDTAGDIFETKNSGVKSVGVTWGLDDRATLVKEKPTAIIDYPSELIDVVGNMLS